MHQILRTNKQKKWKTPTEQKAVQKYYAESSSDG